MSHKGYALVCVWWSMVCGVAIAAPSPTKPPKRQSKSSPKASPYQRYIEKIQRQLKKRPKSARLHTILGRLYQSAGHADKARRHYKRALQYKKGYSHAQVGLAHLALRAGKLKRARQLLKRVLRREPRHAPAWAEQSELWRAMAIKTPKGNARKARIKKALEAMQKAVIYKPKSHRYRYRLGLLYLAMRQPLHANIQFATAHAGLPFHPCYKLGLAVSESMLMRRRPTLYQDLKVGVLGCGHPLLGRIGRSMLVVVSMQRAQMWAGQKQLGKAIGLMKEATRLAPHVHKGFFYLAVLQYQNNQCLQSRKTLRKLLRQKPDHKLAKKLLQHSKALKCGPLPSGRFFRKTYGRPHHRRAQKRSIRSPHARPTPRR